MLHTIRPRRPPDARALPDLRGAAAEGLCGLPVLEDRPCRDGCRACVDGCPTGALARTGPAPTLDLGRCVFCRGCEDRCEDRKIRFGADPRLASGSRDGLVLGPGRRAPEPAATSAAVRARLGRSLRLWRAVAGDCGGCEAELRASVDAHFDLGRWGVDWAASPRDADGLVLSGPITAAIVGPLRRAWAAIPEPRLLIAVGACAISGGLYHDAPGVEPGVLAELGPHLFVPGCPPHPLTFIHGVLDLLGIP